MTQNKLLDCPFCGGEGRLTTNTAATMSWVACPSCGLEAPSETGVSADDAVAYWNTRALSTAQAQEPVAKRIDAKLADLFPEWEADQRELIADLLARAALPMPEVVEHYRAALDEIATPVHTTDSWYHTVKRLEKVAADALYTSPPAPSTPDARVSDAEMAMLKAWAEEALDHEVAYTDPVISYGLACLNYARSLPLTTPSAPDAALREANRRLFTLEWVGAARPPVHPDPMTGRQSFKTFSEAVAFMKRQAADAVFVSLFETEFVEKDWSGNARAALSNSGQMEKGA